MPKSLDETIETLKEHQTQIEDYYIGEVTKKWPKDVKQNAKNGIYIRMRKIQLLKGGYPYNTMDMIVVALKLYDYSIQKETIYGTLFCELIDSVGKERRQFFSDNTEELYGNVVFTYYSASPSYISCDGEYRLNFAQCKYLLTAKKIFSEIWNEIANFVSDQIPKRNWSLSVSYFYPKMKEEQKNTEVEFAVKNEGISRDILYVAWFQTWFQEVAGMNRSNINENFHTIFFNRQDVDLKFMKSLITKYGKANIELFNLALVDYIQLEKDRKLFPVTSLVCGWKMIPLNVKEVQDPLQLRYKPWREWYVSNRLSDMTINAIAPGFGIILDWFYIKNSKSGLYDNKSQYDRMKHSEIAKDILHTLYEAQRGTYFASENIKESDALKQWVSSKFKRLSEKIDDPINYSIEEIIMSEVTLAFAGEYLGRTFADIIRMHKKAHNYNNMIGYPFDPRGYQYFAKYIFEICYNLYCMHSRFYTIHADLHLNNATIGELYPVIQEQCSVMYDVGEKYVFPNNGFFGCLIDFSRCIIHPDHTATFMDKLLPSNYKIVANDEKFRSEEILNLLNLYTRMFPNKVQKREELILLFKTKLDVVFKILSAIDLFMFSVRLVRFMRQEQITSKHALSLVENIEKISENYLGNEMNKLIENSSYAVEIEKMQWPAEAVIKKLFIEFELSNLKVKPVLSDYYNVESKIEASLDKYDLFPGFMQTTSYVEKKDGVDKLVEIKEISKKRSKMRYEQEAFKLKNLDMLNYIAERHRQKLV